MPEVVARHDFPHADHFVDAAHERRAAQLGMWLFLATEILLFGGLFTAFANYRTEYLDTFRYFSAFHLDWIFGTLNTLILLCSSFFVAAGVRYGHQQEGKKVAIAFALGIAMGCAFLVLKYFEYSNEFREHLLPGKFFAFDLAKDLHEHDLKKLSGVNLTAVGPGAPMLYVLYFFITGLHGIHVIVGMSLLAWIVFRALRKDFQHRQDTPIEMVGLYWHLVDVIWIFVYPVIYLL